MKLSDTLFFPDDSKSHTHVAYPTARNPKLHLPLDRCHAAVGLRFFMTEKQRAKLFVKSVLGYCQAKEHFRLRDYVVSALSFSDNDLRSCTVLSGSPGPYQKFTVLQLDPRGTPLTIFKVATNNLTRNLLKREAANLHWAQSSAISANVPTILSFSDTPELAVLGESAGSGQPLRWKRDRKAAFLFLQKIHSETAKPTPLSESNIYWTLHDRYNKLAPQLSPQWRTRYERTLGMLHRYQDEVFTFVRAHRDFAYWNMRITKHGIFVFDWEFSAETYPELYDYFHFVLMPHAVCSRLRNGHIRDALDRAMGGDFLVEKTEQPSMQLLLYLLDVCSFYLESNNGNEEGDIVVRQYGAIIDNSEKWIRRDG